MPYLNTSDGTALFIRDWGHGDPILFVHGWGLNSDMWEYQLPALVDQGLRCVAYDRRGCGRSDQPGDGYDFDTLADDLAGNAIECATMVRSRRSRCSRASSPRCGQIGPAIWPPWRP